MGWLLSSAAAKAAGMAALEPCRDIDQQRETRGVGFGKAVISEALDLREAALGEGAFVTARDHALDQFVAEMPDRSGLAERGHGAAQRVGFVGGEAAGDHGDAHGLFLEERNAESLAEHLFEFGRWIIDRLLAAAAAQIGMHHAALDRPRPHDRHFDRQVVETARREARQHRHLGAAFDLEDAERIGAAQHVVDARILRRHGREAVTRPGVAGDQVECLADAGEHPEPQHIDLENAQGVEVVLVPLDDGPVLHRRVFDRRDLAQRAARDHEAADMLREMAREADQFVGERQGEAEAPIAGVEAERAQPRLAAFGAAEAPRLPREGAREIARKAERSGNLAGGGARAVGDHRRRQPGAVAPVSGVDILNDFLAPFVLEIDVDVRRLVARGGNEALEQNIVGARGPRR